MQTITVELLNENALPLLQQLEDLKIIKLNFSQQKNSRTEPKKQWAGKLSRTSASKILQHIEQSRDEWQRI